MRITDTKLYKAVSKGLPVKERRELSKQLKEVQESGNANHVFQREDLMSAFMWSETPQGYHYWAGKHAEHMERAYPNDRRRI